MKHEINTHKEWYTCDRCGKEIHDIEIGEIFSRFPYVRNKYCKLSEFKLSEFERKGHILDTEFTIPEIVSIKIIERYFEKEKIFHLCGKCQREFKKFMGNKTEASK